MNLTTRQASEYLARQGRALPPGRPTALILPEKRGRAKRGTGEVSTAKTKRLAERCVCKPTETGFSLVMPYPPAVNSLYATVRGRRVLSREGRIFKASVKAGVDLVRPQLITSEVLVVIRIYRPQRSGDLDGRFKSCLDSLTGTIWVDDSQVVSIKADRFEDKDRPRAEVEVIRLGGSGLKGMD